jgi:dihydropteroate synthase
MSRFMPRSRYDWQLRSRTLTLGERTLIMAIVNLTPDSFSGDGHLETSETGRQAIPHATATRLATSAAIQALDEGADILDLGAESTRPNAAPLAADEEQARLFPVLEAILSARPQANISVDTYHASTARAAARLGAEIINDVSGLKWDPEMAATVALTRSGVVLMHTRGRPQEWVTQPPIEDDEIVPLIFTGLCEQLVFAESAGIATNRIVIDPGFGFGKRGLENITLLAQLRRLNQLDRPILAGISRKGFLGDLVRPLQQPALPISEARRSATIAAHTAAILSGVHILRVHEVQPAREAAAIADALLAAG